ncbi:uncharacterized protein PAC_08185 [Phialocephala subalpina]|uniref:Uncharacterized protein n=1 Tax=Phialocephala subalpina TaxID=576137 RepID=A0A1L7WZT5_9HELO|nr:uncharacterized protein PAC_08185 [Phialocephala subalpina]
MAMTTGIVPGDLGLSSARIVSPPKPSSPILSVPKRSIRRKSSFIRQPDSSEDYPSPHDSIYEAVYFSGTNSDSSGNRIELIDIPPRRSNTVIRTVNNDENRRLSDVPASMGDLRAPPPIDEIEIRYGWGTPLETITEQKSFTTLRSTRTTRTTSRTRAKSADDVPSIPFLGHRDSFSLVRSPRRKASFSYDDIAKVQQSYHEACATIEREIFKLPINEVYAEPKEPIRAPPERPPTPDGMPSWTAAQNAPRPTLTRPHQNVFQRFFGLPASTTGITFSTRIPQPNTQPRGRAVSAPVRGRMAPRFRPPRSAYGPIDQHPFANAPIAQVKSTNQAGPTQPTQASGSGTTSAMTRPKKQKRKLQRVRFTPSATARDSEIMSLQAAIESTSTLAIHPLSPMPPIQASPINVEPSPKVCPHRRRGRETLQGLATNTEPQRSAPAGGQLLQASSAIPGTSVPVATVTPVPSLTASFTSNSRASLRASALAATSTQSLVTDDPNPSRTTSFGSSAYLMSGGLRSPSRSTVQRTATPQTTGPEHVEPFCWKCAADGFYGMRMLFNGPLDSWDSWICICIDFAYINQRYDQLSKLVILLMRDSSRN